MAGSLSAAKIITLIVLFLGIVPISFTIYVLVRVVEMKTTATNNGDVKLASGYDQSMAVLVGVVLSYLLAIIITGIATCKPTKRLMSVMILTQVFTFLMTMLMLFFYPYSVNLAYFYIDVLYVVILTLSTAIFAIVFKSQGYFTEE